jgi:hypothetical protein
VVTKYREAEARTALRFAWRWIAVQVLMLGVLSPLTIPLERGRYWWGPALVAGLMLGCLGMMLGMVLRLRRRFRDAPPAAANSGTHD